MGEIRRPKRMKNWVGMRVINRWELETQGGVIFPPGTEFTVQGVYRGLSLETVIPCPGKCPHCRILHKHEIRRVPLEDLEIVPIDPVAAGDLTAEEFQERLEEGAAEAAIGAEMLAIQEILAEEAFAEEMRERGRG